MNLGCARSQFDWLVTQKGLRMSASAITYICCRWSKIVSSDKTISMFHFIKNLNYTLCIWSHSWVWINTLYAYLSASPDLFQL